MNDDYQDVRVLDRRPDLLEFEVVVYPFNTVAEAIAPNPRWSSRRRRALTKRYRKDRPVSFQGRGRREAAGVRASEGNSGPPVRVGRAFAQPSPLWLRCGSEKPTPEPP
jgi:hypothetical protein